MAWECQRAPAREAEAARQQWQRLPYSRCTFDRVAHLVGQQYRQKREAVERALVKTLPIPAQAHSISVSLDRVSVPMEEPRSGPAEYKKNGTPKRMIQRVYRMAYAATVTLHDIDSEATSDTTSQEGSRSAPAAAGLDHRDASAGVGRFLQLCLHGQGMSVE
jgi:hypothetical protein